MRNLMRRLKLLESRSVASDGLPHFSAKILLVGPGPELSGVLLLETGQPTKQIAPTPEDIAEFRRNHRV